MKLRDYLHAAGLPESPLDPEITGVSNDSRKVTPGMIFCAIPGSKADGSIFIPAAVKAGAAAIIAPEGHPEYGIPNFTSPDLYRTWGLLCECEAGFPSRSLTMHAVTGTNGKTTTAMILQKIYREAFPEEKCGLVSTVLYDTCGPNAEEASRTTPDAQGFQRLLSAMRKNGCTRAVMEASSHGLHQHRTGSMKVRSAIFTNLTGDHLDYHKTMENYFQAKKLLFTEMPEAEGHSIINADDPWGNRLAKELSSAITYSNSQGSAAKYTIKDSTSNGTRFLLETDWGPLNISTNLIGSYNVCNITGAALAALADHVPAAAVEKILNEPISVPGRLEGFSLPCGARIFVDYAHTDDALERVLTALRPLLRTNGKLICVFGCGGDRDRTKRPRMGRVAAQLADKVIVTDDNPRSELPAQIAEEIFSGMPANFRKTYQPDRMEAIRIAGNNAGPDDIILLAGKGHEKTQEINGIKHPFDDRTAIRQIFFPENS